VLKQLRLFILAAILPLSFGCSTVSVPVMQFETGEAMGIGHYRGAVTVEASRIFPFAAVGAAAVQTIGIFQGGISSARGEIGLLNRFDLGIAALITSSGGGWKLQGKYQFISSGLLAVSGMLGYGITSGSGGITYLGAPVEDQQNLTLKTLYFSFPASYRLSPTLVVYAGLIANQVAINGIDNSTPISTSSFDLGADIGVRARVSFIDVMIETAFINVSDPFSNSSRISPYGGLSLGVAF